MIALVRSKATYQEPQSWSYQFNQVQERSHPCAIDLFAATADVSSISHELPGDSSELHYSIVYFYTRLLVLRCYEDYNLRHDPEPIQLQDSDRVTSQDHPHILAMHRRRLELVKFQQALYGYLGPLSPEHKNLNAADDLYRRNLQGLLTDAKMLSSLYDNAMRIYNWYNQETNSDYKAQLASEQLEEARQSKATAISLGKLSNLAFLYLPLNFVCAMLGMNLSIFGQGQVPLWVFLVLVVIFSLLTYLPISLHVDEQRIKLWRLTFHLTRRSVSAGFWFLAFSMTHDYRQNFEIMNAGLAQVFLGYRGRRTKGWVDGRDDRLFEKATWGSETFWRKKMKKIFLAVEELEFHDNGATGLTV